MFKSKKSKKRKQVTLSKPWAKALKEIARSFKKSKKSKRGKAWTKKVNAFVKSTNKKK